MKILKLIIDTWNDCSEYYKSQEKIKKLYKGVKFHKVRLTKKQIEMINYLALKGVKDVIELEKLLNK